MRVDLRDQAEIRLDDPAELVRHPVEPAAHGTLQIGEGDRRDLGAHSRRPAASRWMRSLRSMNWMSTAIARS